MDVYIFIPPPLPVPRDEIEQAIEEALDDDGEVTGGGSGESGANIDVELFDDEHARGQLETIRDVLRRFGVPRGSYVRFGQERFHVD